MLPGIHGPVKLYSIRSLTGKAVPIESAVVIFEPARHTNRRGVEVVGGVMVGGWGIVCTVVLL
jgi:hypothetical protein